jgi:hypothetical protein
MADSDRRGHGDSGSKDATQASGKSVVLSQSYKQMIGGAVKMRLRIYSSECEHYSPDGRLYAGWLQRSYEPLEPGSHLSPSGYLTIRAGDVVGVEVEVDWVDPLPLREAFTPDQLVGCVVNCIPGFRPAEIPV